MNNSKKSWNLSKRKIGEWIHRIFAFTIFQSFITFIAFVVINFSIPIFQETNNLGFGIRIALIQFMLAILYLAIANMFYWILDINIFDFKRLWGKK
jgi:uncharacterized membrane protein (DUF485 family)